MIQIFKMKPYFQKRTVPAFCLLFFLTISHITIAQNSSFKVPDSLKNKSYEEYASLFYKNQNDSIIAYKYANLYLIKAKKEKDTIRIARGFSLLASLSFSSDLLSTIINCDSIIKYTKNLEHFEYPAYGYLLKGISNFQIGNYDYSLNNYLIAQKYALKNKNIEQLFF